MVQLDDDDDDDDEAMQLDQIRLDQIQHDCQIRFANFYQTPSPTLQLTDRVMMRADSIPLHHKLRSVLEQ